MATKDEASGWFSPTDALRRVQELGTQLTGAARSMAEEYSRTPAGQFAAPMARLGEQTLELSTLWVAPLRAILEEQQQLIEAVSSWAEEQRKLADRFAELARRHREMTEQVSAMITPTLDQLSRLSSRDKGSAASDPS